MRQSEVRRAPRTSSTGVSLREIGPEPTGNALDLMINGTVQLLINTPMGKHTQSDDYSLRQMAIAQKIPYTTTLSAANAATDAILALRSRRPSVRPIQEWHAIVRGEGEWGTGNGERSLVATPAAPVAE